jgi:hypothetical protein
VRISFFPFSIIQPVHRIHLSIIDPTQSQQLTASLNSELKKKIVNPAVHVTVRFVAACGFSKVLDGFDRQTSERHSVIQLFVVVINCHLLHGFPFLCSLKLDPLSFRMLDSGAQRYSSREYACTGIQQLLLP